MVALGHPELCEPLLPAALATPVADSRIAAATTERMRFMKRPIEWRINVDPTTICFDYRYWSSIGS
jgi:hypothetical protein